jgi:hypothetical protein
MFLTKPEITPTLICLQDCIHLQQESRLNSNLVSFFINNNSHMQNKLRARCGLLTTVCCRFQRHSQENCNLQITLDTYIESLMKSKDLEMINAGIHITTDSTQCYALRCTGE